MHEKKTDFGNIVYLATIYFFLSQSICYSLYKKKVKHKKSTYHVYCNIKTVFDMMVKILQCKAS